MVGEAVGRRGNRAGWGGMQSVVESRCVNICITSWNIGLECVNGEVRGNDRWVLLLVRNDHETFAAMQQRLEFTPQAQAKAMLNERAREIIPSKRAFSSFSENCPSCHAGSSPIRLHRYIIRPCIHRHRCVAQLRTKRQLNRNVIHTITKHQPKCASPKASGTAARTSTSTPPKKSVNSTPPFSPAHTTLPSAPHPPLRAPTPLDPMKNLSSARCSTRRSLNRERTR